MPNPTPQPHPANLVPRARREALSMAGAGPGRGRGAELAAAALRAHRTLSAGFGHTVPVTALGPGCDGVRGLTAFLAVYAAEQRTAQSADVAA